MFAYLGPPTRRVNVQLSLDPGAASGTKVGDRDMSQLMPDRLCGSKLSGVSRGFLITVPRRRSLSSKVGHGLQALLPRPAADLRSHDLWGPGGLGMEYGAGGGMCAAQPRDRPIRKSFLPAFL